MYILLYMSLMMLILIMFTSSSAKNSFLVSSLAPQDPLPPCAIYIDCSTGRIKSYNFLRGVLSATTCQEICERDTQCRFYSYNYNTTSPHYLHCYLSTGCEEAGFGDGWISGPGTCDLTSTDIQNYVRSFLLRATR